MSRLRIAIWDSTDGAGRSRCGLADRGGSRTKGSAHRAWRCTPKDLKVRAIVHRELQYLGLGLDDSDSTDTPEVERQMPWYVLRKRKSFRQARGRTDVIRSSEDHGWRVASRRLRLGRGGVGAIYPLLAGQKLLWMPLRRVLARLARQSTASPHASDWHRSSQRRPDQ